MSQPTKGDFQRLSDLVASVDKSVTVAHARIDELKARVEKSELAIEKARDQISTLQAEIQVLAAGFEDFKKRWDESERRRWTIFGVFVAATLTFVANLVLLILRK